MSRLLGQMKDRMDVGLTSLVWQVTQMLSTISQDRLFLCKLNYISVVQNYCLFHGKSSSNNVCFSILPGNTSNQ